MGNLIQVELTRRPVSQPDSGPRQKSILDEYYHRLKQVSDHDYGLFFSLADPEPLLTGEEPDGYECYAKKSESDDCVHFFMDAAGFKYFYGQFSPPSFKKFKEDLRQMPITEAFRIWGLTVEP
jgi:hypothetical protein